MQHVRTRVQQSLLMMSLVLIALLGACRRSEVEPEAKSASVKVTVSLAKDLATKVTLGEVKVELKNINTGRVTTLTTTNGVVTFEGLPVDRYDILATYMMSPEDVKKALDKTVTEPILFSASATGVQLQPSQMTELPLELMLPNLSSGDFVIKTIYYAGSDKKKAAGESDQFVEIYNNSSETLYADGLSLAVTVMNRYAPGHKNNSKRYYYTPDGRYDWSKSQGMPSGINANDDYYYATAVVTVPGSGKEHPVAPGASIVIAAFSAQNYREGFKVSKNKIVKDPDGKVHIETELVTITPERPDLTVDLSGADFEAIYKGYEEFDNVKVPNLLISHPGADKYLRLSSVGKQGYVIFRHAGVSKLPAYTYPAIDPKSGSQLLYMQIPNAQLLDAVETITPTADGYLAPKALQKRDDAGYTYVPSGEFSSKALTRKVARREGTRIILQDTNNSTLDFVEQQASPRSFAE